MSKIFNDKNKKDELENLIKEWKNNYLINHFEEIEKNMENRLNETQKMIENLEQKIKQHIRNNQKEQA